MTLVTIICNYSAEDQVANHIHILLLFLFLLLLLLLKNSYNNN